MGELADAWSSQGVPNAWGAVPQVVEMQSEGGAAGAVHGAFQAGSLATTFTTSQGLLLMLPNMFKIAGELTPAVIHVAARTVATHALSIFGDHSDVMAARTTGFALLCSSSVQEAHDLALVAHAATLRARVPFLHFFDGFRTSHELSTVERLTENDVTALLDEELVRAHRARALSPDDPVLRGSAQNPDVFFQAREAVNPFYAAVPGIVQEEMARLAARTGRSYRLFDYVGHPEAERVLVLMGSGAGAAEEAVERLCDDGERVGLVKVRLYRPFDAAAFVAALPASVAAIAVLDRTKEPAALGEPLFQDVVTALAERGGPALRGCSAAATASPPRSSRPQWRPRRSPSSQRTSRSGGSRSGSPTTSAGSRSTSTRRSGRSQTMCGRPSSTASARTARSARTGTRSGSSPRRPGSTPRATSSSTRRRRARRPISHLRFGPEPIRSTYLVQRADFVACHQFGFLERIDVLELARRRGDVPPERALRRRTRSGSTCPWRCRSDIVAKRLRLFVVDATRVAREAGLGKRVNTVLQTCFFALADVMPREDAIAAIKEAIRATYGKRGEAVLERNFAAVDRALEGLAEVEVPAAVSATRRRPEPVPAGATGVRPRRHRRDHRRPTATGSPSPRCRSTAPSRPALRSTRSARSRTRSRSGIPRSASTARSARSSAPTPRSA